MKRLFKITFLLFLFSSHSFGQEVFKNIENSDSIPPECRIINDSLQFWTINTKTRILKSQNNSSIWHKIENLDFWKIDTSKLAIDILPYNLKLWINSDSTRVWTENKRGNKESYSALFTKLNDSTKHWRISDSLHLIFIEGSFSVWKVNPYTKFHKISFLDDVLYMNDTAKLWLISDSLYLWTHKDSTVIWEKKTQAQSWTISSSTKIWSINDSIEFWQANGTKNFWKENKLNGSWTKIDSVQSWLLGDSSHIYRINSSTLVKNKNEDVSIWKSSNKIVYSILNDKKGKVWKVKPPPKIIITVDTLEVVEDKTIKQFLIDNNTHVWNINDSVKIWRLKEKIEVWESNNNFKIWNIDDSTKVITIAEKIRLSFMNNKIHIWFKNDTSLQWKKEKTAKLWKFSETNFGKIWVINEFLKYSEKENIPKIWNTHSNYNIANIEESWRGIDVWKHQKNIEIWTIKDELRLFNEKDSVSVWREDKSFSFMKVNDSTKVWQVNSEIRLSQVNGILKVWIKKTSEYGKKWIVADNFMSIEFQYQGKPLLIKISKYLHVWQHNNVISFWRRDLKTKVWTISDILKIYSFVPIELTPKEKRKSFWKIGGIGGLSFSETYLKNWVKGGDNKLALLSSVKLHANYVKKKVNWKNELEIKLGSLKPGENDFRKNEDLLKFNLNFGLKATKNWLLSFNSNTTTQFLKGYSYPNDSVPVSRFISPLKHIGGFGSNYYSPNKKFSLFISPLSLKSTFVNDTTVGQTKYGIPTGKKSINELGFQLKTEWKHEIWKDINLLTKLSLFSSYLENPEKIDVDWETNLYFQLNKYIKTTIFTHILYDYDIKIPILDDKGVKTEETTDAIQFKQTLSIGFSYNF